MPGTIRSVLRGERPVIRSNGLFVRDYFYVEDGAAAYMLLAEQLAENPASRGSASTSPTSCRSTCKELVDAHPGQMKSSLEPEIRNEASNEIVDQWLTRTRARDLSWKPLFSLEGGLQGPSPGIASSSLRRERSRDDRRDLSIMRRRRARARLARCDAARECAAGAASRGRRALPARSWSSARTAPSSRSPSRSRPRSCSATTSTSRRSRTRWSRTRSRAIGRFVGERGSGPPPLVFEVASNDGYLLQFYKRAGVPVLGIEPAATSPAWPRASGASPRCASSSDASSRHAWRPKGSAPTSSTPTTCSRTFRISTASWPEFARS